MNRRRLLALAGIGVGVPGGYFAWERYRSPALPDRMDVETLHTTDSPTFALGEEWEDPLGFEEERHHDFADAELLTRQYERRTSRSLRSSTRLISTRPISSSSRTECNQRPIWN